MVPNRTSLLIWILGLLAISCSEAKKAPPPQPEVEALLKQRAETEKREAEADVNPKLGVTVTWTIQSVEVRPQPANETEPYLGTIKFVIESQTPELDGVATERLERSYEYAWDPATGSWLPKY